MDTTQTPEEAPEPGLEESVQRLEEADAAAAPDLADELARRLSELLEGGTPSAET